MKSHQPASFEATISTDNTPLQQGAHVTLVPFMYADTYRAVSVNGYKVRGMVIMIRSDDFSRRIH